MWFNNKACFSARYTCPRKVFQVGHTEDICITVKHVQNDLLITRWRWKKMNIRHKKKVKNHRKNAPSGLAWYSALLASTSPSTRSTSGKRYYGNFDIRHCPSCAAFKFFLRVRPQYFGIGSSQVATLTFFRNNFIKSFVRWPLSSPRQESRHETSHEDTTFFLSGSKIKVSGEKHEVELESDLQKLINALRHPNLLRS